MSLTVFAYLAVVFPCWLLATRGEDGGPITSFMGKKTFPLSSLLDHDDPHDLFQLVSFVNKGNSGKVYKSYPKRHGHLASEAALYNSGISDQFIAVKVIYIENEDRAKRVAREVDILRSVKKHSHLLDFVGAWWTSRPVSLDKGIIEEEILDENLWTPSSEIIKQDQNIVSFNSITLLQQQSYVDDESLLMNHQFVSSNTLHAKHSQSSPSSLVGGWVWLVTGWIEGTSLRRHTSVFSPSQIRTHSKALFRALAHLHAHGISHCDLDLSNIIYDTRKHQAIIIDVGDGKFDDSNFGNDIGYLMLGMIELCTLKSKHEWGRKQWRAMREDRREAVLAGLRYVLYEMDSDGVIPEDLKEFGRWLMGKVGSKTPATELLSHPYLN